jgi:hypothetical protein
MRRAWEFGGVRATAGRPYRQRNPHVIDLVREWIWQGHDPPSPTASTGSVRAGRTFFIVEDISPKCNAEH